MSKVLMTGATGHIGYPLLLQLIDSGADTRILIRKQNKLFDGLDCEAVYGDINDYGSLVKAFEGIDTVYHLAGMIEIKNGNDDKVYNVNVNGTKNVIKACRECGVRRLVYMSSVDTYPPLPGNEKMTEIYDYDPAILEGTYAKTKAAATAAVLAANGEDLETVVVQPSACIGPYDFKVSSVGIMVRMYLKGQFPVTMSFGGYNFVDVRDVAAGTIAAGTKAKAGEVYILCGDVCTVDEFVRAMAKACGKKPPVLTLHRPFVQYLVAPVMDVVYKVTGGTPLITPYSIRKLLSNCNFSYEKAARELGYKPMSVEQSVSDMIGWIRENENIG